MLVKDPVIVDLRAVIDKGLYGFAVDNLQALPQLFASTDTTVVRKRLLSCLMADDPDLAPTSKMLGQSTSFNLALFGATSATKMLTATGRRMEAGKIYRPANPVSADGVRKHPSAKQPSGGPEWRLLFHLREQILTRYQTKALPASTFRNPPPPLPPSVAVALGRSWRRLHHLINSRPTTGDPIPADVHDAITELGRPIDYILHTLMPGSRR